MWFLLLLSVILPSTSLDLQGEFICPHEEIYKINVTRHVLKKYKIRQYKWCMEVPPRCSYYIEAEKIVPVVEEKESTKLVARCCPGYKEDKGLEKCIATCPQCHNGICKEGKCKCDLGYGGEDCSFKCAEKRRWGKDCEFECQCERGDCDLITGYCTCPQGWKGVRCEAQIIENVSPTAENSTHRINEPLQPLANTEMNLQQRLRNLPDRKYPILEKYNTFHITSERPATDYYTETFPVEEQTHSTITKVEDGLIVNVTTENATLKQIEKTTENFESFSTSQVNTINFISNGKPQTTKSYNIEYNTRHTNATERYFVTISVISTNRTKALQPELNLNRTTTSSTLQENLEKSTVDIVQDWQNTSPVNQETRQFELIKSNEQSVTNKYILTDDFNNESVQETHQQPTVVKKHHLIFSIGTIAGFLITAILVLIASLFVADKFRKKSLKLFTSDDKCKELKLEKVNNDGKNAFHAPLPDPPIFDNPVFVTPIEFAETNPESDRDSQTISMLYDHPPSTGSYRAASLPEPPEPVSNLLSDKDHLYDEIPCWKEREVTSSKLQPLSTLNYYENTSTKF